KNIILTELIDRCRQYPDTDIPKDVPLADMLASNHGRKEVGLIEADAPRLIRIGKLHAEAEPERGRMFAFVPDLELGREVEVADVVRRVCAAQRQRDRARSEPLVDVQKVLNDTAGFDLDILCQTDPERRYSQPCQISIQSRKAVRLVLQEIEAK